MLRVKPARTLRRWAAIALVVLFAHPVAAADEPVAPADAAARDELAWLRRQAETELRRGILPFWHEHTRDRERGGFSGQVDWNLRADRNAPRGALLTSRILWTFSAAYRRYHEPAYREMADWAFADLIERFWDAEHGGVFWSVRPDGAPLDPRKHIYGQVFAIYGLTEYHRATGDLHARERAQAIHRVLETHARDRVHGGYIEEMDRGWRRREDLPPRQRLMGSRGTKSQNAHLHIMEAYTALLQVWRDDGLREDLRALTEVMLTRVLDPDTSHLRLFFTDDWTAVSREISYGHDIEFSWLVCETAEVLGDPALIARARAVAVAMADACLREGVDRDGGVCNEGTAEGWTDAAKDWWPQAEAAVGFLNAWEISRDVRFLAAARRSWEFIDRHVVNHHAGEWYASVDPAGRPDTRSPAVSMWKCPYHNSRACLETIARAERRLPQTPAP